MKNASRLLIIATLAVAAIVPAVSAEDAKPEDRPHAQRGERGKGDGRQRFGALAEHLGLNDDQKSQVASVRKDEMEQMRLLREDTSLAPEDRRAKAREINEASAKKIEALLTPEQQTKFREMRERMRERRGGPGGPGGPGGGKRGEGRPPKTE